MCMYTYILYIFIYIHIHIHINIYIYVYIYRYISTRYVYTCMQVQHYICNIYMYIYIHIYIYIYIYIYMYICLHIHKYVYMHTYICTYRIFCSVLKTGLSVMNLLLNTFFFFGHLAVPIWSRAGSKAWHDSCLTASSRVESCLAWMSHVPYEWVTTQRFAQVVKHSTTQGPRHHPVLRNV